MFITSVTQFCKRHFIKSLMIITGLLISSWPSTLAQNKPRKWERSIKAYENGDKQKMPELGGVLFIGSSSIRGWKSMKQDFP